MILFHSCLFHVICPIDDDILSTDCKSIVLIQVLKIKLVHDEAQESNRRGQPVLDRFWSIAHFHSMDTRAYSLHIMFEYFIIA